MNSFPTRTADQSIDYYENYNGKSLLLWAQIAHRDLAIKSGWGPASLPKPGSFGFDSLVHSIKTLIQEIQHLELTKDNVDVAAYFIHQGWIKNYVYWRDMKPWKSNTLYARPSNTLGDEKRNSAASTKYQLLSEEEQSKHQVIAASVLSNYFDSS
jgi:hypothetical protein